MIFGNSPKHDNILITPVDKEALNSHLKTAQGKVIFYFILLLIISHPHRE
jgi:hypothetical protein